MVDYVVLYHTGPCVASSLGGSMHGVRTDAKKLFGAEHLALYQNLWAWVADVQGQDHMEVGEVFVTNATILKEMTEYLEEEWANVKKEKELGTLSEAGLQGKSPGFQGRSPGVRRRPVQAFKTLPVVKKN